MAVSARTRLSPLITRETVWWETCASAATSAMVADRGRGSFMARIVAASCSADAAADREPDQVGDGHRDQAAGDVAEHGTARRSLAEAGTGKPVSASATITDDDGHREPGCRRPTRQDREQRQQRAHREREHRGPGGVPRVGEVVGVDAELDLRVRARGRRAR